jgi:peptidoglycan/LPS O-acetylase OafA/YrhL
MAYPNLKENLFSKASEPSPPSGHASKASRHMAVLDAVRGAAALYVVCHHARILLLMSLDQVRYAHLSDLSRALVNSYSIFVFGHQAVVLFFVLSGFCIHYRQANQLQSIEPLTFNWKDYALRRLIRIVPPFYWAILFTFGIDWATRAVNAPLVAHGTSNLYANFLIFQYTGIATLAGNLIFVQSLIVQPFGNDTPLWSLAYEFYLYALYPLYLRIRTTRGSTSSLAVVFLLSAVAIGISFLPVVNRHHAMFFFLPVIEYWFCWVVGATAAEACAGESLRLPKWLLSGGTTIVGWGLWFGTVRLLPTAISDTLGSFVCAQFLLLILSRHRGAEEQTSSSPIEAALSYVGQFSYSLYLTHVPCLALICAFWFRTHLSPPQTPWLFLVGVAISLVVGKINFWLVEERFLRRRKPGHRALSNAPMPS